MFPKILLVTLTTVVNIEVMTTSISETDDVIVNRFGDLNESTIAVTIRQESTTLESVPLPNFTTDVPKTTTIINGDLITATSGDSLDTSTAGSTDNDNIGKVAQFAHMTFIYLIIIILLHLLTKHLTFLFIVY